MSKWLVAFDTDKIKQYVFRTSTLKEIRGASALLDRLNCSEMPQLVGGDCIYANGGGGLFVIDADDPQAPSRAIASVEKLYTTATHSGSITGAAVPMPANPAEVKNALALVRHKLRAAKAASFAPQALVIHPLFRFCDVCGVEYAESDEQDEQVCRSCAAKRAENRTVQEVIVRWIGGERRTAEQDRLWPRLIAGLGAKGYPLAGHDRPETFEDLGETSRPRGYMGLIYADGDNMGRIIEGIDSTAQLGKFSEAVDGALHDAVADAVAKHLKPGDDGAPLPFDVLLLGGDDLVMVTSAHKAMETAAHIVQKFADLTKDTWGQPLSLSASVTLTHTSYPIGSLIQLADSGLKFAKRTAAERRLKDPSYSEGLINFLVVNSPNHVEFSRYYRETLRAKEGTSVLLRTMRPYTAGDVQGLLTRVRSAHKAPRAKLEQLRAAVFKTRRQGRLDAMKAVLRTRGDEQRQTLFELVGKVEAAQLNLPWIKRPEGGWTTPILDVVELLDFVDGAADADGDLRDSTANGSQNGAEDHAQS